MAMISIAGFMSTNVDKKSINAEFLSACSIMLSKMLHTDVEHVTLELQTNVDMVRGGSMAPMVNLRLFHNSDKVDSDTKHDYAKQVASWLARHIRVPEDRVLVLFLDTRYCNAT